MGAPAAIVASFRGLLLNALLTVHVAGYCTYVNGHLLSPLRMQLMFCVSTGDRPKLKPQNTRHMAAHEMACGEIKFLYHPVCRTFTL